MDSDQGSERRLNYVGTRSLWRILGYRWSDFVSNEQLLRETQMRVVTCIVRERQLHLYGHVVHFPNADPAQQILSAREPREWRRPMGRPRASLLQQVDQHLKEMGMGQASAGGMARRRLLEYWRKVDAATRCLAHAPIPELMPSVRICSNQITLPDQMQPSGTAKHIPAKKRIAGEQRPG